METSRKDRNMSERIFVYDGREWPDPDPAMTPDDVRQQMADSLPELSNATFTTEQRGDVQVITFQRRVGTKGADKEPKLTPSNCRFARCRYNTISPPENAQECIGCEGNVKPDWMPKR